MKRIILTAMALFLMLALCACNGEENPATPPTSSNPTQTPTGESTQAPASEPTQGQDGRGDVIDDEPTDDGRGDFLGSDPPGGVVAWWGTYVGSDYLIEISEVDISSFYFVIKMTTTTQNTIVTEGSAEIDETGFFAMSGEMGFSLYDDFSAVDIFASESSEWADLRGKYEYTD